MYLDVFDRNPYGTNCWLLAAEGSDEVVVVDPGFEPAAVRAVLDAAGKRPAAVLLTHAHLDHAGSAGSFAADVPVYVHPDDVPAFSDYSAWGGMSPAVLDPVRDLRTFVDGDVLRFAGLALEVLHTPGHTPGRRASGSTTRWSSCRATSCSRHDRALGLRELRSAAMRRSLIRFLTLSDAMRVLPGHGAETTVGTERASNPFLREAG
jgi:glyoxylase-like metal-dependent hydrolase (beta-lactamase superfamily II)